MYEEQTPEAIKARILSGITKLDTREGSFADDMAGPIAVELSDLYAALNAVRYMVWVDETSGNYLDLAAEDLGMEPRKPGTRAEAVLELKGQAGYTVPAGSAFFTEDHLYFELPDDAVIPEGGVLEAEVTAREVGAVCNVPAHSILHPARCDARLEAVDNPGPAQGGADPESDASLYRRIVAWRQRPATSGNEAHYEQWALEVPGVGVCRAQGLWNGPGTVKVLIADEDSQPVSDSIREVCAAHIEDRRPIGPEVTVRSASTLPVTVEASVQLKSGADLSQTTADFRERLEEYFRRISLVRFQVRRNRVGSLLISADGVVDYHGLTLNGRHGDLVLTTEQVPVVDEVVLTWA